MKMHREAGIGLALAALLAGCVESSVPETGSREARAPVPAESTGSMAPDAPDPPTSTPTTEADPGHYTSLELQDCVVIEVYEEAGGSTSRCKGLGGFELLVQDVDARMSVGVVSPGGETTKLNLITTVGQGAFSSLGPRAEWRFDDQGRPSAMIVRFNAYMDPEQPDRPTSYLVVSRLADGDTCPVATVEPGPGQNTEARRIADAIAGRACLPDPAGRKNG